MIKFPGFLRGDGVCLICLIFLVVKLLTLTGLETFVPPV